MTHNHLCTCITLTKWDTLVMCVNITENVENFQSKWYLFTATKTSVTVSVKQHEHDRVTRCTFSVDYKEIKNIPQSLPSTYMICWQPWQSSHHRGEIQMPWLSGTVNCWVWIQRYFSQDEWHIRRTLRKWQIKVPKANSRWYVEYVQLVYTEVDFHCSKTLRWISGGLPYP